MLQDNIYRLGFKSLLSLLCAMQSSYISKIELHIPLCLGNIIVADKSFK